MYDWKAVIFDMDGTLLDSYEAWERAFCVELKKHGIIITKEEFIDLYKMTDEETRKYLEEKIKILRLDIAIEQVYALLFDSMAYEYENKIQPKPGALAFMRNLWEKNMAICVATLTHSSLAEKALRRTGMMQYLKFIITGDDVGKSKEFPDIFIQASRKLGSSVRETAVFEDSLTAARTASKAGFMVYGVYDRHQSYDFNEIRPYTQGIIFNWEMDPCLTKKIEDQEPIVWINPDMTNRISGGLDDADVKDAGERLLRFAPLIEMYFPETRESKGLIESPLTELLSMKEVLNSRYGTSLKGRLFMKMDSHLPIAGSIKARGGIYEVLKHAETLARSNGLLFDGDNYEKLADPSVKDFYSKHKIQVGSTGNLGLSIGIMGAKLGFETIVHMSSEAKQWKKELLEKNGVHVITHNGDYEKAVAEGRSMSNKDPQSYFIDDENSPDLFLGYAVAAQRLASQFQDNEIRIDKDTPLFVYIPCGVGGAPGGLCFGLKLLFGENVHCFFVEPTQAPCMLLGMATKLHSKVSVKDIGLSGITCADGLAVGRPSAFAGKVIEGILSGVMTVEDSRLYDHLHELWDAESIFIEPSACASIAGIAATGKEEFLQYLTAKGLEESFDHAVHVLWSTGGNMVPLHVREQWICEGAAKIDK